MRILGLPNAVTSGLKINNARGEPEESWISCQREFLGEEAPCEIKKKEKEDFE